LVCPPWSDLPAPLLSEHGTHKAVNKEDSQAGGIQDMCKTVRRATYKSVRRGTNKTVRWRAYTTAMRGTHETVRRGAALGSPWSALPRENMAHMMSSERGTYKTVNI